MLTLKLYQTPIKPSINALFRELTYKGTLSGQFKRADDDSNVYSPRIVVKADSLPAFNAVVIVELSRLYTVESWSVETDSLYILNLREDVPRSHMAALTHMIHMNAVKQGIKTGRLTASRVNVSLSAFNGTSENVIDFDIDSQADECWRATNLWFDSNRADLLLDHKTVSLFGVEADAISDAPMVTNTPSITIDGVLTLPDDMTLHDYSPFGFTFDSSTGAIQTYENCFILIGIETTQTLTVNTSLPMTSIITPNMVLLGLEIGFSPFTVTIE